MAAFAAGLTISGGAYFLLRASVPDYNENFSIAGLESEVDILRDSSALPHITAGSAADIYFAIGFVHAQDRLGQLLRARRATRDLLPSAQMPELDAPASEALEAYAAGINAWLSLVSEGGRGKGSPELLIANVKLISAWRPVDSIRVAQGFLNSLNPETKAHGLPGSLDVLIPPDRPMTPELFSTSPKVRLNAWALSGDRTATEAPILAADISGSLSLPSEWYLADLQLPSGAAIGATLPGVPFVVIGRNERVAWAFRSIPSQIENESDTSRMMKAGDFLMTLDRLARSVDAIDAANAAKTLAPVGLEVLAVDHEILARWPESPGERPETFRDARLAVLDERQPIFSVESAIAVQRDTVSAAARSLLPLMARELWFNSATGSMEETGTDALRREILDDLAQWNGEMDRYSPEPLVFWAWVGALQRRILQDEFPAATEVWSKPNPDFLYAVLSGRDGDAIWCDIRPSRRIETCEDQAQAALDDALSWLVVRYGPDPSAWSWGEAHVLNMQWSPVRTGRMVSDLLSLQAPMAGDPTTLMSTMFASEDAWPYESNTGTNFQAVMTLSDESGSYFIAPAGQSGHPLSRFYENLFPKWMQGEYLPMATDLTLARGGAVGTSRLSPVSANTPQP